MTKTMDNFEQRIEQIEKFASQCYEDDEKYSAFIAGAIWADNNPVNVWHDASEEPKWGTVILCLTKKGNITMHTNINKCLYTLVRIDYDKWAYITDLLPKGGAK